MDSLITALVAYLVAHPRALAITVEVFSALALIAFAWQAIPKPRRDAWELRYPRRIGVLRFICEAAPGFIGMFFAARQVANGQPKHPERVPVEPVTRVAIVEAPGLIDAPPSDR